MLDTIVEGLEATQDEVRIHVSGRYTSAFSVSADMYEDSSLTSDPATELQTRTKAESGEKVSLVVHLNKGIRASTMEKCNSPEMQTQVSPHDPGHKVEYHAKRVGMSERVMVGMKANEQRERQRQTS